MDDMDGKETACINLVFGDVSQTDPFTTNAILSAAKRQSSGVSGEGGCGTIPGPTRHPEAGHLSIHRGCKGSEFAEQRYA
jgi:hypothetical protein